MYHWPLDVSVALLTHGLTGYVIMFVRFGLGPWCYHCIDVTLAFMSPWPVCRLGLDVTVDLNVFMPLMTLALFVCVFLFVVFARAVVTPGVWCRLGLSVFDTALALMFPLPFMSFCPWWLWPSCVWFSRPLPCFFFWWVCLNYLCLLMCASNVITCGDSFIS